MNHEPQPPARTAGSPKGRPWLGHIDGGALLARMYFHLLDGHSLEMAKKIIVSI